MNPYERDERRRREERDFNNPYPEDNYRERERITNPFRNEDMREDRWSDYPRPYGPGRNEMPYHDQRPRPQPDRYCNDRPLENRERNYENRSFQRPGNYGQERNHEDRYYREREYPNQRDPRINPHFEDMGGGDFYERAAGCLRNVRQEIEHPEWARNNYPQENYPPLHNRRRRHEDENNWHEGDNPYMGDTLFF